MKYCTKCGTQAEDDALFCSKCGHKFAKEGEQTVVTPEPAAQATTTPKKRDESLLNVAFIFCVIACVFWGFGLIPLIWMVPLTVMLYNKIKNKEPIDIAFKVVVLIFVSLIGGILLIVGDDCEL